MQHLAGGDVVEPAERALRVDPWVLRRGERPRVLTCGMRVVGLVEDVVGEPLDREQRARFFEPETPVDLPAEVFGGQEVVLGVLDVDAAAAISRLWRL